LKLKAKGLNPWKYLTSIVSIDDVVIVFGKRQQNGWKARTNDSLSECEAFLHTFNMKICIHKTRLEVELLCSCSLTSKVVQCNAMKFTKNLMHCVHLEDTKTLWEDCNSP